MRALRRLSTPVVLLGVVLHVPLAGQAKLSDSVRSRVDQVFADLDRRDRPGCALAVYLNGQIAYERGYGMASLELGVPISPASFFDIGSTSKQFAAFSIFLLKNDGKLSLSDDVRKYIPELPRYDKPITIRHLLQHTSGLRDYNGLLALAGHAFEDYTTDDDALDIITRQKAVNYPVGTAWSYTNTGFFLLSTIIKRVSGKTLREFAQQRIFDPLGMRATHFHDDHKMIVAGRATAYTEKDGGGWEIEMSNWDQTGDGAVNTSVEDLLRWDENFYQPKVGDAALLREFLEPGKLDTGAPIESGYAHGLFVDTYRGLRRVHHGGAWAGYRAGLTRFPDQHFTVACLCNYAAANPDEFANAVADVVLADKLAAPPLVAPSGAAKVVLPHDDLKAKEGLYVDSAGTAFLEIKATEDGLSANQGFEFQLRPVTAAVFQGGPGGVAHLEFTPDGRGGMRARLEIGAFLKETVTRIPRWEPRVAELREYVGKYHSAELDATYTVAVDQGKLVVRWVNRPGLPITPARKDAFRSPLGTLTFRRTNQRLAGFRFDGARMHNLYFGRIGG